MLYPLNHFLYFILNVVLIFFFLSTVIATASANLQFFQNSKIFVVILALFTVYSIVLKCVADNVCEFWTMTWASVLGNLLVFALEGTVVCGIFNWYVGRSTKVRT
jgi:hypothetical protein